MKLLHLNKQDLGKRLIDYLLPYSLSQQSGLIHMRPCQDMYRLALDCLLYTSDASDERSSVDLGGRRIIKKKNHTQKKKKKNI